ncbi:MAG: hypothetical protein FJ038_14050, partial [Chloroflexi bacterium]|nr:hypothetical protein [Chloroflexota bacterium]
MARAKRTERADARRRYRATQAELDALAEDEAEDGPEDPTSRGPSGTGGASRGRPHRTPRLADTTPTPPRPPSFTAAFRAAARPLNVREDLSMLPQLIRHRSVWIPVVATTAAGVLLVALGDTNQLVNIIAQVFVVPPPMAASFLAGLLAPRASYLAGAIAGLWAALVFTAVLFTPPTTEALQVTTTDRVSVAAYGLLVSPLFGLGVGGFAGYYRRFLAVSSPARRRQEQARRAAGKPAPR